MPPFNEARLEQSIIELMRAEGWTYTPGEAIVRREGSVLIESDLSAFLRRRYAAEHISEAEIDTAIAQLTASDSGGLYERNLHALRRIQDGYGVRRQDAALPPLFVEPIDYERPERNTLRFVNQFEIVGHEKRIPDGVVFVNGIPLVVLEFKNATKPGTTIEDAWRQLTVRYRRDIPDLFATNAFVVVSDGANNKFGSLFAPYEYFYGWRRVEAGDREADGICSLYTLVRGLLRPDRLLEVVHHFVFLPDTPRGDEKIVCRYPQYFAATLLRDNILRHCRTAAGGDGKGGTYFGATGCGKSYTMLFLARLLMRCRQLESPTLLFITDRTDLDDQLSEQLLSARHYIGDNTIVQVESRERLGGLLRGRTSGGVFLTTIQKFTEATGLLSDRANIVCISDEAHRTQTTVGQKLTVSAKGVRRSYGFAHYLRESLPRATYVGFSGTPVEATFEVFGPEVDRYTMAEAVADGITRRIVYEGRAARVIVNATKVKQIETYYEQCADEGATDYQIEESKRAMTRLDVILNDPELLANIAADIVDHYEKRIETGATVEGKAMIVVSSRSVAWNLYKALLNIRPQWAEVRDAADGATLTDEERKKIAPAPKMRMVITADKDDAPELHALLGTDDDRKAMARQFKQTKSNFRLAIVVDMWITGFDVPCLDTMYLFKPLQMHTLVQTISRVNRAYPGKEKGLVVDYLGIKKQLNAALKQYGGGEDMAKTSVETIDAALRLVLDELDILRRMFLGFDRTDYLRGDPLRQLECLNRAVEHVQATDEREAQFMGHCRKLHSAYNICAGSGKIARDDEEECLFYFAIRSIILKMTRGDAPDATTMNRRVLAMLREALSCDTVEEIQNISVSRTGEIELLSDDFLERLRKIPFPNTKAKLLESLLRQVVSALQKVNKTRGVDFAKRLDDIVRHYNDRSDDAAGKEIVEDVFNQMMTLLDDIANEHKSGEPLGLKFEEKAFFDILKDVAVKYNFYEIYGDDKLKPLAVAIKQIVDDKAKYTDWNARTDIRAELQMDVLMCLAAHNYPPREHYNEVYKEILEQAENFKRHQQQ